MKMGHLRNTVSATNHRNQDTPIFFANVVIYTEDPPDDPLESAASLRSAPPPLYPVWP